MTKRAAGNIRRIRILSLVILAVFLLSPATSQACSGLTNPPNYTPPPIADRVNAATHVFEGNISTKLGSNITVNVNNYFKGTGPSVVNITGFGGGADCRYIAPKGEAIFFVWGEPQNGFQIDIAWKFGNLPNPVFDYKIAESYSAELADQLVKVTGHQPVLPVAITVAPTPTPPVITPAFTPSAKPLATVGATPTTNSPVVTSSTQSQDTTLGWLVPVGGSLVVLILALGGLFLLRNRRNH